MWRQRQKECGFSGISLTPTVFVIHFFKTLFKVNLPNQI